MMTTMAALVGALPIALGHGAGAEARRPLGVAVVGGLLFSQIITLYIAPVVYTYLDAWRERLAHRKMAEPRQHPGTGPLSRAPPGRRDERARHARSPCSPPPIRGSSKRAASLPK